MARSVGHSEVDWAARAPCGWAPPPGCTGPPTQSPWRSRTPASARKRRARRPPPRRTRQMRARPARRGRRRARAPPRPPARRAWRRWRCTRCRSPARRARENAGCGGAGPGARRGRPAPGAGREPSRALWCRAVHKLALAVVHATRTGKDWTTCELFCARASTLPEHCGAPCGSPHAGYPQGQARAPLLCCPPGWPSAQRRGPRPRGGRLRAARLGAVAVAGEAGRGEEGEEVGLIRGRPARSMRVGLRLSAAPAQDGVAVPVIPARTCMAGPLTAAAPRGSGGGPRRGRRAAHQERSWLSLSTS